ncbi:MAG: hypothetical protein LBS69_02385 [Prevotellaceae bacterium]|jgi:hypothetical protein|nr:hypothetical protein [Prevotellaceae bacterium]
MKKIILKTAAIMLLLAGVMISCGKEKEIGNNQCDCDNKEIIKVLIDEPGYIIKGCFNYSGNIDTFYYVGLNNEYTNIFGTIFPCKEIPAEFKIDNMEVLISGNVINCTIHDLCIPTHPEWRIAPANLFELKSIKIR